MASSLVDKQTVFLVPSVALAIQQEAALSANLPLSVGTAHGVAVFSPKKRAELAKCNVLVATHGACLALLDNYGDLFQMNKWNLLIIDECHNCTGNSTYVTIMENYYHKKTEVGDRPRVLGLTASPLINVKLNQSEEQLGEKLAELENIMDSTVVSIENLGLAHDDKDKEFLLKEANSIVVEYDPMPSGRVNCWPSADEEGSLYSARRKEFRRLAKLYGDVGPFPVFLYARKLKAELIRNTFEGETQEEFENAILFIADVLHFCRQDQVFNLVSDKLCALENLLKQEIEARSERLAKGVGVVFVQNRITALALNLYFNHRFQALDSKLPWPPSCDLAPAEGQREPLNPSSLRDENGLSTYKKNFALRNNKRENCSRECDQFMDADEDDKFCGQVPLEDATFNQFEDADFGDADSVSPSRYAAEILTHCRDRNLRHETPNLDAAVLVRCGSLVRNQNQLFKSLRHDTPPTTEQEMEMSRYFHDEKGEIRKVINDLRFGKINVLVATSVVEEGVDVQACSFVVVFDRLTTLKNYIQMKGRARASDAKFFVFQNRVFDGHSFLALDDARTIDRKMNAVLRTREPTILVGKCDTTDYVEVDGVDTELNAARCGFFGTS